MTGRAIRVGPVMVGGTAPLALIAGPCVIESRDHCLRVARRLAAWARAAGVPLIFKASYDKANRTSVHSYRGPGLRKGLEILAEVKQQLGLPILTDVHAVEEVGPVAEVVDVLQIPAFLCRQTDLVVAAARSGRAVNVKKGQFLSPQEIRHVVEKIEWAGNHRILLTERGTTFGYQNLVVDFRSLVWMAQTGYPVVFDATHSVQRPGGAGDRSGGDAALAPALARAAVAVGCAAVFLETHPQPARALSDGANSIPLRLLPKIWRELSAIAAARRNAGRRR
ncbi:MAG: 3-deoxy-8-phosphooctulonate synthase [Kiritimatiellae bacterium]|nr:3-deoxy-8-phosphooctulonate synthase [Kiritimatiellia bacterium]